jgi:hypothetical protein
VPVRRGPVAVAVLALLAVTACEKPAPKVTVTSNGRVINVDAERYCRGDKCTDHAAATKAIKIRRNSLISFDVPKRVAEHGWNITLGEQRLFEDPRTESHYVLSIPDVPGDAAVPVTVTQGKGTQPEGVWKLQLLLRE